MLIDEMRLIIRYFYLVFRLYLRFYFIVNLVFRDLKYIDENYIYDL